MQRFNVELYSDGSGTYIKYSQNGACVLFSDANDEIIKLKTELCITKAKLELLEQQEDLEQKLMAENKELKEKLADSLRIINVLKSTGI
jgi:hypothetical protein